MIQPSRSPLDWRGLVFLVALLQAGCGSQPTPAPRPSASEAVKKEPASKPIAVPQKPQPHFAVQIGAFEDRIRADALASHLSDLYQQEFLVAPVEVHGKTLYRVRFLVETRADAEALANNIDRDQGLKAWIVPLR